MAELFGKYQLHEKIAQGGMAEVFVASKHGEIGGFKRRLAIKRMFPHLVDREDIITMFIDEARIASRLNHPNIVQIYDLGVVDEAFFIAMEFVEGLDLRRVCELGVKKRHFLSRELAVRIVAEVCAGLHYAHARTDENGRPMKVVHRDVSPQNVLISVDGAVKLCDFGIAKAESRLTETRVGEFKGKFSYMSPEQFGSGDLDHRSDIFTLGIVLYETTVAARLFKSKSEYEAMRRITEGDFQPPSAIRADYPPRLEAIVMKALAIDRDLRYQSAADLHEDLEQWLFDQRVRTGPRQIADYLSQITAEGPVSKPATSKPLPIPTKTPSPARPVEETEDPTMQLTMSEEELRRIDTGRAGTPEEEDSTVQMTVSEDELAQLDRPNRQPLKSGQRAHDDSTIDDMTRPFGVSEESLSARERPRRKQRVDRSADAVEIRRISPQEAQRRREGAAGVEIDHTIEDPSAAAPADDDTTSEIVDSSEDLTKNEVCDSREITGEWTGDEDHGQGEHQIEPALTETDCAQSEESKAQAAPHNKSPSSTSSLIGKLPDLRPGGRELTGLNEIKTNERKPVRSTKAMPAVRREETSSSEAFGGGAGLGSALVVVAVGALVAVLAIGIFMSFGDDEEASAERDSAGAEDAMVTTELVGDEEVDLHIKTDPPGAFVVANGVLVDGETPLQVSLVDKRDNEIWIVRRHHRPAKLLIPALGESMERTIELERASATGGASVDFQSTPAGAEVFVNGESLGQAPFRMENVRSDSPVHVQFELEGHRRFVAFVEFQTDQDEKIDAVMTPEDEDVVRGSYEVTPRGSRVLLAQVLLATTPFDHAHRRDEWLELEIEGHQRQSRQHRLRLDQIGSFKIAVPLQEEALETGELSVEVDIAAAVYVDSRAFGAAPLQQVELPAGEQTVVFETLEGSRVRVKIEVEADAHRKYKVAIDGDDAVVDIIE